MYSGEISVAEDQIIPLVHAAKSLAIKGLLDVPVPGSGQDDQLKPPPTKKAKIKHKTAPTPGMVSKQIFYISKRTLIFI